MPSLLSKHTASPSSPPSSPSAPDDPRQGRSHDGVRVRGLSRGFDGRVVLENLDLDIAPGEFVALLGPSGSGKSTLLRAVGGLDGDAEGQITVPGRVATVFQEHRLLPWERVWKNVTLGLGGGLLRERAVAALGEVGLADRADAWPGTLSGGEAQRVALARALVRTPQLLLLDEPFAALDALTRLRAQQLVERLWEQHRPSVLLVTHDVEEALLLADRAVLLGGGALAREFVVDIPRPRPLDHPRFVELRRQLLTGLGVDPDAGADPDRNTDSEEASS
jgi:sulfonate transport system ATP-binding protein